MTAKQFRKMTEADRSNYYMACAERDNLAALGELKVFEKYLDKPVRVVKGRKVPIGTEGTVFWIKAVNYSKYCNWWSWEYRIGFKDVNGNAFFTSEKNIELVC